MSDVSHSVIRIDDSKLLGGRIGVLGTKIGAAGQPAGPVAVEDSTGRTLGTFNTIQAAVDYAGSQAGSGKTIVADGSKGSFIEQVTVDPTKATVNDALTNLTIKGVNGAVLQAPSNAPLADNATSPSGSSFASVLALNDTNGVHVTGLIVDGNIQGANLADSGASEVGISAVNATGTVLDGVTVKNVREPDASFGDQRGLAVYATNSQDKATNTFTVENSTVSNFQKNGITARNAAVTITGNTITGVTDAVQGQNGIEAIGTSGTVSGNTIQNVGLTGDDGQYDASGIIQEDGNNLTIDSNTITLTGKFTTGIFDYNGTRAQNNVSVTNNTIVGAGATGKPTSAPNYTDGIQYSDGTGGGTISGNKISNFDVAIEVDADTTGSGQGATSGTAAPAVQGNSFGTGIGNLYFLGDQSTAPATQPNPQSVVAQNTFADIPYYQTGANAPDEVFVKNPGGDNIQTGDVPTVTTPANGIVTNNNDPAIAGTGVAGDTITLTITGPNKQVTSGTTTVGNDGTFSVTPPNPLVDGTYQVTATQTDPVGNTSQPSTADSFSIDTVAPTVQITSPAEQSTQASQTITGTVTSGGAAAVAGQSVTLTDNGVALVTSSPVTVGSDGSFTAQVTLPNQGQNVIVATAQDSAGNTGSATVTDTLYVAPTLSNTAPNPSTTGTTPVSPFTGVQVSDNNAGNPTETLTITQNGAGTLTGAGTGNGNVFTLTGSTAAVNAQLQSISFTPAQGTPGTTSQTSFALSDTDNLSNAAANTAVTVTDTTAAATPTGQPSGGQPTGGQPSGGQPSGGQPSGGQPSGGQPSGGQPTGNQPTGGQSNQPVTDAISVDPVVTYRNGAFTITGRATSTAGVTGIDVSALIDGQRQDLGAASLNADGSFAFTDAVGATTQSFIFTALTDGAGGTAGTDSHFDLTAGIADRPFVAKQDSYDPATNAFKGQTFFGADGGVIYRSTYTDHGDGTVSYDYAGGSYFDNRPYSSFTDLYQKDGTLLTETRNRTDGSHAAAAEAPGQTLASTAADTLNANGQASTSFVFTPGYGQDTVLGFKPGGPGHDTLTLPSADFTNLADVLRNTHNGAGGAVITDPTSGDTITIAGVSKAELVHNKRDFTFHA